MPTWVHTHMDLFCFAVPIQDSLDMWRVGGDRESEPAGDLLLHVGDSKLQQVIRLWRCCGSYRLKFGVIWWYWYFCHALRTVVKWSNRKSCNQRPDLACCLTSCRDSARLFDLNFTLYKGIARMTTFECKIIPPKLGDIWKECWNHGENTLTKIHLIPVYPFMVCHHVSPFVTIVVSVSPRPWWLRRRTTRWWVTGSRWNMCPNSDAWRQKLARRRLRAAADIATCFLLGQLSNTSVKRLDKNYYRYLLDYLYAQHNP